MNRWQFRQAMIEQCQKVPANAALLLSGGLDSGVILAGMLAAGRRDFKIYVMRFSEYGNEDFDAALARHQMLCADIPLEVIEIKRDIPAINETVEWAVSAGQAVMKTSIEVMVVMRPLLLELHARGEHTILNGMAGGGLWGVGREQQIKRRKLGEPVWKAILRFNALYDVAGYPVGASRLCRLLCSELNMAWMDPLFALKDLMLAARYAYLNEPQDKSLAVKAFPELGYSVVISSGLQVRSGVREYMDQIVARELGFDSALTYYGGVARDLGIKARGSAAGKEWWDDRTFEEGYAPELLQLGLERGNLKALGL